jgi:hypothetical protein
MMLSVAGVASAADIDVMTQNQYVGTDLIGLVESDDFNAAVIAALQDRAASLPTERAKALAALIHKRGPGLVGLQEVYKFTCLEMPPFATQDPDDGKGCDNQSIAGAFTDQLEDTLAALGGKYVEAATVVNLNLPDGLVLPNGSPLPLPEPLPGIPIEIDGMMIFLGVIDRDIILARSDIDYTPVPFAAAYCPTQDAGDGCNYDEQATAYADIGIAVPGAGTVPVRIYFTRGFVGIDATVSGVPYRFVTTHLETRLESVGPAARSFQSAQAFELLTVLDRFPMAPGQKLLVVGDMNSDPRDPVYPTDPGFEFLGTPPYLQFTAAGFTDAWTKQPATPKGKGAPLIDFTCCQLEDLSNVKSDLYERIDLIFSKAPIKKVPDAKLLGESMGDKTLPKSFGVWPSDHASVATRIQY